jgi:REP element-mobilizing transposase RayT
MPNVYYHIYNRGNNRENIFFEAQNYRYFLQLYTKYVDPIADTYAYCLLPNHFHLLVRIKVEVDLTGSRSLLLSGLKRPSQYFSNFFNAYSKAINVAYKRTGALFQRPFGRVAITANSQLFHLVAYIHQNPQKHGLVSDFRKWPYSSFQTILSIKASHLNRTEVLEWFGGRGQFKTLHDTLVDPIKATEIAPDD